MKIINSKRALRLLWTAIIPAMLLLAACGGKQAQTWTPRIPEPTKAMFEELVAINATTANCPALWKFFGEYYRYRDFMEAAHANGEN